MENNTANNLDATIITPEPPAPHKLRMDWSKFKKYLVPSIFSLFLVVTILAGVKLAQQSQDLRGRASSSGPTLSLRPANTSQSLGQTFDLQIMINTGTDTVSAVDLYLTYDPAKIEIQSFHPWNIFSNVLTPTTIGDGKIRITLGTKLTNPFKGPTVVGVLKVKSLSNLKSSVTFASNTAIASIGKPTNSLGSTLGAEINSAISPPSQAPIPSTNPIVIPTDSDKSPRTVPTETPIISNAGIEKSYEPWALWAQGTGFSGTQKFRIIDIDGKQWGDDLVVVVNPKSLSARLPSNSPPSQCNIGKTCIVSLYLVTQSGSLSNRSDLELPAK